MGRTDGTVIERQGTALLKRFSRFTVTDNASCESAIDALKQVKQGRVRWAAWIDPQIAAKRAAHEALLEVKRKLDVPLSSLERWLKDQVGAWERKLQLQAERAQLEAEQKAEAAAQRDRDRELKALKEAGRGAEAKQLSARPLVVAPVVAPIDRPQTNGLSFRSEWEFEIVDERLLPREYLSPDRVKIGRVVRALKDKTAIPGIKVRERANVGVEVTG